ncbi:MAG: autotransporter-associated beta strand repeat-containing protein, partial [Verrucomicrobia bacterium]|nr:autotransporter-associated beta strand repeat-containing protein [Verrucomicrobiota bacterium]
MIQSSHKTAIIIKPRCAASRPRFALGWLAVLGVFLALSQVAQAMVTINSPPTAQTVCAPTTATFTVDATASAGTLLIQWYYSSDAGANWTATPDGGNNLSTAFSPTTASENGWQVKVILADDEDMQETTPVTLTVYAPPTVAAGGNQTICRNASTTGLGGTVGGGATGGTWTTTGTGSFVPDATTLNATYTPSTPDATAGAVTLTLTSVGQNVLCPTVTAHVQVTIHTSTVNAGSAAPGCLIGNSFQPGLNIRAWNGPGNTSAGPLDGAQFNLVGPSPAPNDSTAGGTIGYATQSIFMDASGPREQFVADNGCGVASPGPFPTGYTINYSLEYRGKLYIATAGNYRFATTSDDGSALWIDAGDNPVYSEAIVQNNYAQGMTTRSNATAMALSVGYHDIIVRYNQGSGGNGLDVQWDPSGGANFVAIPGNLFYHGSDLPSTSVTLGGSYGGAATGAIWSGGAGTFTPNNTAMSAVYAPSNGEITAGTTTLTLTAMPCQDATSQVVLHFGFPPAAPATVGAATCGAGVVNLSASGSGGTLKWYADAGLTTLLNTGSTYAPTISATTTFYVTETSAIGCQGPATPVTGFLADGVATVGAGPNQLVSATYGTVQLAGSMANTPYATWSGGSGTFNPNNTALNAIYTPSATEKAAASWVLTLSGVASPCGGSAPSSSVTITYQQLVSLPFNTNTSTLAISLMMHPASGSTDLGSKSTSGTSKTTGYMAIELDNPDSPTKITVQNLQMTALSPYLFAYTFTFASVNIPVTATIGGPGHPFSILKTTGSPAATTTINQTPGANGGTFNVSMPFSSSGVAYYGGTASGVLDLSLDYAPVNMTGSIFVTNDVATAHIDFTITTNINVTGSISVSAVPTFVGHADMVGPTILPRNMVWNGGTFNWNTTDLNWNLGTAKWNNMRPDSATFGATGSGTVNLTAPITAGSLWFQVPGYTVVGSGANLLTLAPSSVQVLGDVLANLPTITNDVNALISASIAGSVGWSKWGVGTLALSGANTYSGGTFVNAGVLEINDNAALGAVPGTP